MGEVVQMTPGARLVKAYEVVHTAAPALALGNDPASGFLIIAHAALTCAAHAQGAAAAARAAEAMAAAMRASGALGWARPPHDDEPRPAA